MFVRLRCAFVLRCAVIVAMKRTVLPNNLHFSKNDDETRKQAYLSDITNFFHFLFFGLLPPKSQLFFFRFFSKRNYVFDFDRLISFRGNTAMYLLYAYARMSALLRQV